MRAGPRVLTACLVVAAGLAAFQPAGRADNAKASAKASAKPQAPRGKWKQVHPMWRDAYVLSFRSPDLLTNDPDERWGLEDGRLVGGGILTDLEDWLKWQRVAVRAARKEGRPILFSIHTHSGYGTGLVTYAPDLKSAEAVNYPWLIRRLLENELGSEDVTVTIDTCNAHATAAHQLRRDLVPGGVEAWPPFARWRRSDPHRKALPVSRAYQLYSQDRVRLELSAYARGSRSNVRAAEYSPLTADERREFRARVYGPKGVILGTPSLFNLLRLGTAVQGTLTANLLKDRLDPRLSDSYLSRNKAECRRFNEFAFFRAAGPGPDGVPPEVRTVTETVKETVIQKVREVVPAGAGAVNEAPAGDSGER